MAEEESAPPTARRAPSAREAGSQAEAKRSEPLTEDAQRAADVATLARRLAGKPAAEILARISNGDPLRLQPLCTRRLRELSFSLDPERVYERALGIVAVGMEVDTESGASPEWLCERVDRAIHAVLERDREAERSGVPAEDPEKHFALFVTSFYVEPALARLASVRLNDLDVRIRKGFQKLLIEGLDLDECLAQGLGPPEQLQLDILIALKAIGLLDDEGVEELRWKGGDPE